MELYICKTLNLGQGDVHRMVTLTLPPVLLGSTAVWWWERWLRRDSNSPLCVVQVCGGDFMRN